MFDLPDESLARHGDCFFLKKDEGVFIVSEASLKNEYEKTQKKKQFLYEQRQKVLEVAKQKVLGGVKQKDLEKQRGLEAEGVSDMERRDFSGAVCMGCGDDECEDGVFLLPLCKEAHHHACLECLDGAVKDKQILICPICRDEGDRFGMNEYKKAIGQNEERLSPVITQYQTPGSFSLTQDLPSETLLLTEKTTVTLSNIEVSVKLFLVLLEKTKVTIGERFSITEHVDSEDCIREHGMARKTPVYLRDGVVSSLTLENIERMPPSSIGCALKEFNLKDTGLINILPKLRINEDNKVKWLGLSAREKEHVAAILAQKQAIYVGSVFFMMTLRNYAVSILTKLRIHENSEVRFFNLAADEKEHVSAIFSQNKTFCVGRTKTMCLENYAVSVLTKLRIHKDHEINIIKLFATEKEHVAIIFAQDQPFCVGRMKNVEFWDYAVFVFLKMKKVGESLGNYMLSIDGDELWRKIHEELKEENITICIEKTEKMFLREHAVNILPALKTKGEMDKFSLVASNEDQISEVLAEEYKGISFVGIKEFVLSGSTANLLPKMRIREDCRVEQYSLLAAEERDVSNVLEKEDRSIAIGRVKNIHLRGYAVCVITKLRIHNDNIIEKIVFSANGCHFSRILEERDNNVKVGRIRIGGLDGVPEEIRRKLRYTLVEREATAVGGGEVEEAVEREVSEVVEGEGNEVLEERYSSRRENRLD
ncbi:MAG: uncharacterized protein A8A55_0811 [Amphiamblys sp. WSBS2006]|nr:MAG: uncharacterized protein A8A55_0811 [Amphiamblys sp. WSBS2006]